MQVKRLCQSKPNFCNLRLGKSWTLFFKLFLEKPLTVCVFVCFCVLLEQYHLNNSAHGPLGQGIPHSHSSHGTVGLNKYTSLKAVGKFESVMDFSALRLVFYAAKCDREGTTRLLTAPRENQLEAFGQL